MLDFGTWPDEYTFPYIIKACGGLRSIKLGMYIHGLIKDLGFEMDVYVGSALVKFYADNDCIETAHRLFDKLPHWDSVLWHVMLNGFAKCEDSMDNVIDILTQTVEHPPSQCSLEMPLTLMASKVTKDDETLRKLEQLPNRKEGIFVMPTERITILSSYYYGKNPAS
ncbi:Hypothetical predicted protein [Olea europaea subsp. europaea]|uniref:Pentatricopeptide repeat-containing protein n=1 Tax=Olea europaea subsp. europaea TaxID=158383 RepID=A0A8S0SVG9_OLEEU|nr:Hypothetical predicted protein [Olea europaea subsp. europaea]